MSALSVDGVVAGYGDNRILNDLSIHVDQSEVVCIIGPNGAGKSTCLKVIVGLLAFGRGTVSVGGIPVKSGQVDDSGRSKLGYVPQTKNTFPSLSVRENLRVMTPRDWSRSAADQRVDDLLGQFAALAEIPRKSAALLSGGERQSLALAMAMVRRPEILLLDEPAAALSPIAASHVFDTVGELRATGVSVLIVEQHARLALAASDRCYVLEAGTVALEGAASALLDDPRLGALYLGGVLEE